MTRCTTPGRQLLVLSVGLLLWSVVANLLIGDTLYTVRNLALTGLLLAGWMRVAGPDRNRLADLGLTRSSLPAGARWGLGAVTLIALVLAGAVLLADRIDAIAILLADERVAAMDGSLLYATMVRIPIGTALFEEVAFRGLLLALALQMLPTVRAVAATSAVFGLWHVAPTIVTLRINDVEVASLAGAGAIAGAVLVTTVAGAGFCWLRLRSGSLVAPILAHWATNALGLLAASTQG